MRRRYNRSAFEIGNKQEAVRMRARMFTLFFVGILLGSAAMVAVFYPRHQSRCSSARVAPLAQIATAAPTPTPLGDSVYAQVDAQRSDRHQPVPADQPVGRPRHDAIAELQPILRRHAAGRHRIGLRLRHVGAHRHQLSRHSGRERGRRAAGRWVVADGEHRRLGQLLRSGGAAHRRAAGRADAAGTGRFVTASGRADGRRHRQPVRAWNGR